MTHGISIHTNFLWILLALLCASIGSNAWAADTKGTTTTKEYTQPTDVPDNLDERFEKVAEIEPSFGGMYFDKNGDLIVVLTDTTKKKSAAAAIDQVFGDEIIIHNPQNSLLFQGKPTIAIDDFIVVKGSYGAKNLVQWKRAAIVAFEEDGTVYVDMDETKNRLVIGVQSKEVIPNVEKLLNGANIPLKVVEFKLTQSFTPAADLLSSRERPTLRSRHRPTKGGLEIQLKYYIDEYNYDWWRQFCTLGFNASLGGVRGFFTNSHCSFSMGDTETSDFVQPDWWNVIGREYLDPPFWTGIYYRSFGGKFDLRIPAAICPANYRCRFSDASFSRYREAEDDGLNPRVDSNLTIARPDSIFTQSIDIDPSTPEIPVVGKLLNPMVGMELHKVGKTTGWTYGLLNLSCLTKRHSGSPGAETNDIVLFCQHSVYRWYTQSTAHADHGDSGAPVFTYTGYLGGGKLEKGAYIAGVLWAIRNDGVLDTFIFSPLSGIERDFGRTQVTE